MIKIEHNINQTIKELKEMAGSHLPFVTAKTLTNVALIVKERQIEEKKRVFDRPTQYTLGALFVAPATKTKLESKVWVKDPPRLSQRQHYLKPQVFGGKREYKAFERALHRAGVLPSSMMVVPGTGAKMDAYGNMSSGQIVQILSYFKSFGEQGYRANITDKKKAQLARGSKKRLGFKYFAVQKRQGRLIPGIYQRFFFGHGHAIKPIMIFVKSNLAYRERWKFFEVGRRVVNQEFERRFIQELK